MRKICTSCYSQANAWIGQFKGLPTKLSANICTNDEYNCYQLFCDFVHKNLIDCKLPEEIRIKDKLLEEAKIKRALDLEKILEICTKECELRQKLKFQRRTSHTLRNKLIETVNKLKGSRE